MVSTPLTQLSPRIFKTSEKERLKAKEYYYKNRKKVLSRQIAYKMKMYKTDLSFRKKDNIRKLATHSISLKNKLCLKCGINKDLQRHHPDYSKPLEVIILCRKCHNNIHFVEEKQKGLNTLII